MSRAASTAAAAPVSARPARPCGVAPPTVERLERRDLFARFVPIVTSTNLVADDNNFIFAPRSDANLVNSQAVSVAPNGQLWVVNNGTGTSTVYDPVGVPQPSQVAPLVVTIPGPVGAVRASPTDIALHTGGGFEITANGKTAPSTYLFTTAGGIIAGYNTSVDVTQAFTVVDHSATDVFRGVSVLGSGRSARVYATDFRNGRVEVFDSNFRQVALKPSAFSDIQVPVGYAPFGIRAIKNQVFVTYARQGPDGQTDSSGPAQGIVNVFDRNGKLIRRIGTGGTLNSPFGLVLAPASWGSLKNDLLVGNSGDGTVNIYDVKHGVYLGQVVDGDSPTSAPLTIDGLAGMSVGVKKASGSIYFAAGPNVQMDGVLGTILARKPKKGK